MEKRDRFLRLYYHRSQGTVLMFPYVCYMAGHGAAFGDAASLAGDDETSLGAMIVGMFEHSRQAKMEPLAERRKEALRRKWRGEDVADQDLAPDFSEESNQRAFLQATTTAILLGASGLGSPAVAEPPAADSRRIQENSPNTVIEARGRARILHETLHGALQVMHRDFFREDEGLKIPSRSLEDVFREVARSYGVKLRWIAVDLKAMNLDNEPQTEFEIEAARVLKSGKEEFESLAGNEFRYAGRIRLSATCLSCHASRRSSNDDRAAGLVITMPLKKTP